MTVGVWIVRDGDYGQSSAAEIGGKAKGLAAILGESAPCPPSFCVTTAALRSCVAAAGGSDRPDDLPDLARRLTLTPDLEDQVRAHALALPRGADDRPSLAVRSSFVSEDSLEARSPGIYRSEVDITSIDELGPAILRVWASAFTPEAVAYRRSHGLPAYELGMAVIVQHAPVPVAGGVVYTLLPGTDDASSLLIEFAAGPPVNVVESRVDSSTLVVDKRARAMPELPDVPLRTQHAEELVGWALRLERASGGPLDLEWLVDEHDKLWLLQARRLPFAATPEQSGRFVADAGDTALRSPKLVPFRLARQAAINTVAATVILPAAFAEFKRNDGQMPPHVAATCREVFRRYLSRGPVSVRSAYWSALDGGDMMPQSGLLTTLDPCLAYVIEFWQHVIAHGRDDYTAEVALLVCNWTDLRASMIATVPATEPAATTVAALYGQLDGLEACPHDAYELNLETGVARGKAVPDKPYAVRVPGTPPEAVPVELRRIPVLDADELSSVARQLRAIRSSFGPARVELLVLNGDGPAEERVVTWQVSSLTSAEARLRYFRVIPAIEPGAGAAVAGTLVPIRGLPDISALLDQPAGKLAYVDFTRSGSRDAAMANAMALELRRANCPVVLKGSLLSHFAALLRDYGVVVYPILESVDDLPPLSSVAVVPLA